ncbi:Cdc42-like protein isoform X1 [Aphelenchoides fujianensis]|nr:Cdc42-like protein isoform X1 [Aphelenchoides fujianensis]
MVNATYSPRTGTSASAPPSEGPRISSILPRFRQHEYDPSKLLTESIDDTTTTVRIVDMGGDGLVPGRKAAIESAGLVVYLFSVVNPESYENVKELYENEAQSEHAARRRRLLVGTQTDLRDDITIVEELAKNKQKPISKQMGDKLAKKVKAAKYVECSALTQKGLKNVLDEAIRAALEPPQPDKKGKCAIL